MVVVVGGCICEERDSSHLRDESLRVLCLLISSIIARWKLFLTFIHLCSHFLFRAIFLMNLNMPQAHLKQIHNLME